MKIVLFTLLSWTCLVHSTTWKDDEVPDPLIKGESCQVHKPMSYGGYIYRYPSKYDFVFWPFTSSRSIWYCPASGYMAFMSDFDTISEAEIPVILDYTQANPLLADDVISQLRYMQGIYQLRDIDDDYRNKLNRVYARYFQTQELFEEANQFRIKAYEHIQSQLDQPLAEAKKLEYLYLAANYARQFGDPELSDWYLEQLSVAIDVRDHQDDDLAKYLRKLMQQTPLITTGGAIDPDQEQVQAMLGQD